MFTLFQPVLITPENLLEIAQELQQRLQGKVSILVTYANGNQLTYKDLTLYPQDTDLHFGGVQVTDRRDRGGVLTNSSHLTLIFTSPDHRDPAFHFETNADPILMQLGVGCYSLELRRVVNRDDIRAMIISVDPG